MPANRDVLDYLATDASARAILLYLESIDESRKFMSAARSAARNKPVLVIKSGRVEEGARAAASHTGALAGADVAARHPDMIADFADAGLRSAFIGIESPSPDRLQAMAKGIDRDDVETAIRTFRDNGVEILGSEVMDGARIAVL